MALHDVTLRVLLHEGQDTEPLAPAERHLAIRSLLESGFAVSRTRMPLADAPETGPVLKVGRRRPSDSPDPSASLAAESLAYHHFGPNSIDGLIAAAEASQTKAAAPRPGAWLPWFPVIDYDRCTNCMQCLSFCLFGVYGVDGDGRIQAQHQDNCKTNCPACSRVCPEAAIMFPKYKAGPINGDQISDADLQREKMKIDISALLGGDVYSLLRDRSERARSRFSKERDSDKALAERTKCLTKLGQLVADLPPEVLASLPSPDQIARKAEEARLRAAQAEEGPRPPAPLVT
jgi:NAD-dependent dihydropyrimidine dehydrogenase PreA subunit